jgi:hypothetical protein
VDWALRADCVASSVEGSKADFFAVGTPEGQCLRSPSRTAEDVVARLQVAVTTLHAYTRTP